MPFSFICICIPRVYLLYVLYVSICVANTSFAYCVLDTVVYYVISFETEYYKAVNSPPLNNILKALFWELDKFSEIRFDSGIIKQPRKLQGAGEI